MQKTVNFTGIEDFLNHDACATESMGPIFDRSKNTSASATRRSSPCANSLLTSVKDLQTAKSRPIIVHDPEHNWFPHIDCFAYLLPRA